MADSAAHAPTAEAWRDGSQLVVQKGADISRCCFWCGEPSAARITGHLRKRHGDVFHKPIYPGSGSLYGTLMLILNVVEVLVFCLLFLGDLPASRRRRLTYGLCATHLRRRRLMLSGAALSAALGLGFFGLVLRHPFVPSYANWLLAIAAGLLVFAAFPYLYLEAPAPVLAGENQQCLWVKAGAAKFLQNFPPAAAR